MKKQKLTDQLTSELGKAAAKINLEIKSEGRPKIKPPPKFSGKKSTDVIPYELELPQVTEEENNKLARGVTYTLYQRQKNKVAEVSAWAQRIVGPNKSISKSVIIRLAVDMLEINESTKDHLFNVLDKGSN